MRTGRLGLVVLQCDREGTYKQRIGDAASSSAKVKMLALDRSTRPERRRLDMLSRTSRWPATNKKDHSMPEEGEYAAKARGEAFAHSENDNRVTLKGRKTTAR